MKLALQFLNMGTWEEAMKYWGLGCRVKGLGLLHETLWVFFEAIVLRLDVPSTGSGAFAVAVHR